ncbi:MAG: rane protein, partial [Daejeonella sp.]|nr:rane protein [Daejeonella sp.]
IRIYGYTDSTGTAAHNKQLAEDRANAVSSWLVANGNISQNRISINPVGEAQAAATNATAEGRKQNRRVEIVVRKNSGS